MRWTPDKHDEFLLCLERVLCDRGITDVLADARQLMSGPAHPTISAIHQHLIKLRADRERLGLPCVTKHSTRKLKKPETPRQLRPQFPPPQQYDNDISGFSAPYPAVLQTSGFDFTAPPFPEMQKGSKHKAADMYEGIDDYFDQTPTKPQKYFIPPIP
ncbi:hypothetical protein Slin15195_G049690 [Septoria linicola]|uniref:Uncharacterized protein n=1 Tax=Septoria linicola TaxID=215465 RepID=A0A9Q9AME6_9PEZI|nr:hypothetical protein Slin15195_G049690 [Septoria linicola]